MNQIIFPLDQNYLDMTQNLLDYILSHDPKYQDIEELEKKLTLLQNTLQPLENLEHIYSENLEDILGGVYDTEKRLKKKWQKEDKLAMGLSLGLVYPMLRKLHKQDKNAFKNDLNQFKEEYDILERFLNDIRKMKNNVSISLKVIEKIIVKKNKILEKEKEHLRQFKSDKVNIETIREPSLI